MSKSAKVESRGGNDASDRHKWNIRGDVVQVRVLVRVMVSVRIMSRAQSQ